MTSNLWAISKTMMKLVDSILKTLSTFLLFHIAVILIIMSLKSTSPNSKVVVSFKCISGFGQTVIELVVFFGSFLFMFFLFKQ